MRNINTIHMYIKFIVTFLFSISLLCACSNSSTSTTTVDSVQSTNQSTDPDFGDANTFGLSDGWRFGTKTKDSGHVMSRGSFHNGKKDGAWVSYHNRDQKFGPIIEVLTNYKDGVKHGAEIKINAAGRVEEMAFYTNGKLQGPKTKYQHTATIEEVNYKDGILHGPKATYYIDGSIQMEVNFLEGKRHGVEKFYNQQGGIMMKNTYEYGEKK